VLLLLALGCYYLPWLTHPAAALSANAFDLAEWVGLSPAVRYATPPMVAPFLLRLVLSLLAVLFALAARSARGWPRWMNAGVALLLALTLAPPIEFVRVPGAMDDPNYRQFFFMLAGTLLALGVVMVMRLPPLLIRAISVLIALLAAITGVIGTRLAVDVLSRDPLRITTSVGVGVIGLCVVLAAYCLVQALWKPT
jgi:hypothetical protein